MALHIDVSRDAIAAFCQRWHVTELAFFGSVLRDDFRPDSDIDVLVTFAPGKTPGLLFVTIHDELEALLGRKVDMLTRFAVERSHNTRRRNAILDSAETYYAS